MPATIKHLVVLMMENRSFDHMLGFLEAPDYPIEGLTSADPQWNLDSADQLVAADTSARNSGDLTADPSHDFEDVMEQMYGTKTPAAGQQPDMSGFVRNFERFTSSREKAGAVMRCFSAQNLPVLSRLAREYAVCDHWFSSIPGPTLPNRTFAHAGTSRGRLDLSPDFIGGFTTIYEVLWKNSVIPAVFYHDWSGTMTFDFMLKNQSLLYGSINRFFELCKGDGDTLPDYSFIEPRYNAVRDPGGALPANDQHPDHDVAAGEYLIKKVYEALSSNPKVWESTVLLIVYDEHGGLFDHVKPPKTVSPDGLTCQSPKFDFTQLGPRVPAVVVSPYVQRGTIRHDVFDHTSILATAMKLFVQNNPDRVNEWPSNVLGDRAMQAATFDVALDLDAQPRMAPIDLGTDPQFAHTASMGLSSLQKQAVANARDLESRLPLGLHTNIDSTKIANEFDAGVYITKVMEALAKATADQIHGH